MIKSIVLFFSISCVGCATTHSDIDVEIPHQLHASDSHVYVQPVHTTTDVHHTMVVEHSTIISDDDGFIVE